VNAVFHYLPLHSSTAGRRYGRAVGPMTVTDDVAERLVRLPLWSGLAESDAQRVVDGVYAALTSRVGS
jgi:dTDP-4-amino-4,6-dideoxygalactose transaminase